MGTSEQPINRVRWIHRDRLKPNFYNPNKVAPPELELLERSILSDGWTQPIVTVGDSIVDGFHRWTVSGHVPVYRMTDGYVPTVEIENKGLCERMAATVRHNRARGVHGVLKMADLVTYMLKSIPVEQICAEMGMEEEEVIRLANRKGIPISKQISSSTWSKSWNPK